MVALWKKGKKEFSIKRVSRNLVVLEEKSLQKSKTPEE
jgi:hypothetical protein